MAKEKKENKAHTKTAPEFAVKKNTINCTMEQGKETRCSRLKCERRIV